MAPQGPAPFDFCVQTLGNCRFISQPEAQFSVVTTREPLGTSRAVVLRTLDGKRDVFLSATGATFPEAIQELHSKSADATQNYISLNGFELVPNLKQRSSTPNSDEDTPVNVTVEDDCSSSSSGENMSDAETVSIVSRKASRHKSRKEHKRGIGGKTSKPRRARSISRSRSRSRSPSRSRSRSRSSSCSLGRVRVVPAPPHWGPPRPASNGMMGNNRCGAGPPPPCGGPSPPPGYPTGQPPSHFIPQPMSIRSGPPPLVCHDMILHIHWLNHGKYQALERQPASKNVLQHRALDLVRMNRSVWTDVAPNMWSWLRMGPALSVTVEKVVVDGASIDVRNAGDDLGRLVGNLDGKGLPRFEVQIVSRYTGASNGGMHPGMMNGNGGMQMGMGPPGAMPVTRSE